MYKTSIYAILAGLLLYKFFNIYPLSLLFYKFLPFIPYFGIILCFVLSAFGTIKGISAISSSVSGGSILTPRIGTKSTIGILLCEANFIYGMITLMMLQSFLPAKDDNFALEKSCIIFASAFAVGICSYYSSISIGVVASAIAVMDAKDPKLFIKLVSFEIICSSLGLLGLVIGFVVREKLRTV
ncbi:V-type proton ATPase subunit c'' [Gurleya vavrai]